MLEVQNVNLNASGIQPAVVIAPEVVGINLSEFMRARELFAIGEKAALVQIAKIQKLMARLDPALFGSARVLPEIGAREKWNGETLTEFDKVRRQT
jgi:hypothetical protein